MAACNGAAQSSASVPGLTATATPSPTLQPTASPTVQPAGQLEKVGQYVYAYKSSPTAAFVHYQVIVVVRNAGTGWAQQLPRQSDFTVLNPSGGATVSGPFTYAFPAFIAPGDVGYLLEDALIQDGITEADFASVSAHVSVGLQALGAEGATFTVTDVAWRKASLSDGLIASGFVAATQDVTKATVAVFCLDVAGVPLGSTHTDPLNLTGAAKKDFATVSETLPLKASQCVTTLGLAEETGA